MFHSSVSGYNCNSFIRCVLLCFDTVGVCDIFLLAFIPPEWFVVHGSSREEYVETLHRTNISERYKVHVL